MEEEEEEEGPVPPPLYPRLNLFVGGHTSRGSATKSSANSSTESDGHARENRNGFKKLHRSWQI